MEDLAREVASQREQIERGPARRSRADSLEMVEAIVEKLEVLAETLAVSVGITIEHAASTLEVSQPTVRKWLREGLLERVPESRPAQVTPESVIAVREILGRVRAGYAGLEWTRALAAYLHDRDLQDQPWLREGVASFRAGKFAESDLIDSNVVPRARTAPRSRSIEEIDP